MNGEQVGARQAGERKFDTFWRKRSAKGPAAISLLRYIEMISPQRTTTELPLRTVLHVGSGTFAPEKLHPAFRGRDWREIRLDLDARVKPDLVGSITNLSMFENGAVEAIWSSHNIEHLHDHELPVAFAEFRRILAPDGYAIIATPDILSIAEMVVRGQLEATAYQSPAGPITPLDMMYGHRESIRAGFDLMAHRTAFTAERLARLLTEAGFPKVLIRRGTQFDLWALALVSTTASPEAYADLIRQS